MTGAMRDALELIRSLKKQYPDETEDQLVAFLQSASRLLVTELSAVLRSTPRSGLTSRRSQPA